VADVNPSSQRTAVDPSALDGLRAFGGDALLKQLVSLFREQVTVRTAAIHAGLEAGDCHAVRQAAHALKASAGQVGAVGMQEICNALEREAATNDIAPLRSLAAELASITPAVDAWLTDRGFPR
jgi:HPt (histidine-containing phosphotransfer) domain-containing protein